MQGGKNWIMGPNGGSAAVDCGKTIYAPMIYDLQYDACRYIRGEVDPGCREYFEPCEMASSIKAQITRKLLPYHYSAVK